jgi:hypothetical protein
VRRGSPRSWRRSASRSRKRARTPPRSLTPRCVMIRTEAALAQPQRAEERAPGRLQHLGQGAQPTEGSPAGSSRSDRRASVSCCSRVAGNAQMNYRGTSTTTRPRLAPASTCT